MPRSEEAVAESAALPRSGPDGAVSETATVLKSAAAAKLLADDAVLAAKSAPLDVTPPALSSAITASTVSSGAAHAGSWSARRRASSPSERHSRPRLNSAISRAGSAITAMRTSRRPSAARAWPA